MCIIDNNLQEQNNMKTNFDIKKVKFTRPLLELK